MLRKYITTKSLYKSTKFFFSIQTSNSSFSLKNKINQFFKHVHPDVLGNECPVELKKHNERSMQEINSYIDSLNNNNGFEAKQIDFYYKIENEILSNEFEEAIEYKKAFISLDNITKGVSTSKKLSLQMSLNSIIEDALSTIKSQKEVNSEANIFDKIAKKFEKDETFGKGGKDEIILIIL